MLRVALVATVFAAMAASAQSAPAKRAAPAKAPAKAVAISRSGDLSTADLMSIALLELDTKPDAFNSSPTLKYVGRRFALTQSLHEEDALEYPETNGRWEYDKVTKGLRLFVKDFDNFDVFYKSTSNGTFVGQNGFGARLQIPKKLNTEIVLDAGAGVYMGKVE